MFQEEVVHKKELDQGDIYESHCTVNVMVKVKMSLPFRYYNPHFNF